MGIGASQYPVTDGEGANRYISFALFCGLLLDLKDLVVLLQHLI